MGCHVAFFVIFQSLLEAQDVERASPSSLEASH